MGVGVAFPDCSVFKAGGRVVLEPKSAVTDGVLPVGGFAGAARDAELDQSSTVIWLGENAQAHAAGSVFGSIFFSTMMSTS